jgi:hypothetical protein
LAVTMIILNFKKVDSSSSLTSTTWQITWHSYCMLLCYANTHQLKKCGIILIPIQKRWLFVIV